MSRWTDKADAYVTAYKRVMGVFPSKHNVTLGLSVAQHETACGDAWKNEFNWGAVTARSLNDEERAKLKAAGVVATSQAISEQQAREVLGSPKGLALHRDSSKAQGWYFTWFAAFDNDVDGAAYFVKVLVQTRIACRAVLEDPNGTTRQLAEKMYASTYFLGFHAHDTAGNEANIADYTRALDGVLSGIVSGLDSWSPPAQPPAMEPPKLAPPLPPLPPPASDFADRIAAAAVAHCPCSAHVNQEMYIDVIVRPADRGPAVKGVTLGLSYFCGNSPPSTCGLFVAGLFRLEGLDDPACVAPYKSPPGAVADIQVIAKKHGILESGTPKTPFVKGDVVIIDEFLKNAAGETYDNAHVFVCVEDAVVSTDGKTWTVDIAQGGQFSKDDPTGGSSAIARATTTLVKNANGKWYAGSRWVYATLRCSTMAAGITKTPSVPVMPAADPVVKPEPTPTPDEPVEPTEPDLDPTKPSEREPAPPAPPAAAKTSIVPLVIGGGVVAAVLAVITAFGHC